MKKYITIFALMILLVFTVSFNALGASQVYFDYIVDGEYIKGDLSGFNLGLDYRTDSFKFGIDYIINGEIEDLQDYTQMNVKVGYGTTENIFLTLSMFNNKNEIVSYGDYLEESVEGFLLGVDLSYDFSDKFTFEGSLGFSVTGEYEYDYSISLLESDRGKTDVDITVIKIKLIYNVSDIIGVSFGYNDISNDLKSGGSYDINYITLGTVYKF